MSFTNTRALGAYQITMDKSTAQNILAGTDKTFLEDIFSSGGRHTRNGDHKVDIQSKDKMSFTNTRTLGAYQITMDKSTAQNILAGTDKAFIVSSGVTDGVKYRKIFLKEIELCLRIILEVDYVSATDERKGFYLVTTLIALGCLLGFTGSKKTLVKNLATIFDKKENEKDPSAWPGRSST
jgi:hypothetical protein